MLTPEEFDEYSRDLPYEERMTYRVIRTTLDLSDEQAFVKELESGKSIELYIGEIEQGYVQGEEQGMSLGM